MADYWSSNPIAALRQRPLPALAQQLGYRQDPVDPRRWKRPQSILSINGLRFYDHLADQGGGGAIDLVIHARHCSFQEACRFLESRSPSRPLPSAPSQTLSIPEDCPTNWPPVLQHLTRERGLSANLLQRCRQLHLIRADQRGNAVFVCTNDRRIPTGAEITGMLQRADGRRFRSMAARSRKTEGSFWLPVSTEPPRTAILTESAIDALSACSLPWLRQPRTVFLSTAGVTSRLPKWLQVWQLDQVLCAFDADETGDRCAAKLMANYPLVKRLRPQDGKDWNEILQQLAAEKQPAAPLES